MFPPAITSTNFILSAGLKKCIPIIGLSSPAPISVIDNDDVFVAKIHSGFTILCNSLNVSFLIDITSGATSITKSQSVQMSFNPVWIFPKISAPFSAVIFSLPTRKLMFFSILAFPPSANSCLMSQRRTSYPSVIANACAIPAPIVPAPITPTIIVFPPK